MTYCSEDYQWILKTSNKSKAKQVSGFQNSTRVPSTKKWQKHLLKEMDKTRLGFSWYLKNHRGFLIFLDVPTIQVRERFWYVVVVSMETIKTIKFIL